MAVEMLSASMISLTLSIARVEYVTLWLVFGTGPAGMMNAKFMFGSNMRVLGESPLVAGDVGLVV